MHRLNRTLLLSLILIVPAGCQQFHKDWAKTDGSDSQTMPQQAGSRQSPAANGSPQAGNQGRASVRLAKANQSSGPSKLHTSGPMGQASPGSGAPAPRMNGRGQSRPLQLWGQLSDGRPNAWQGLDAARNVQQMTAAGGGADFDPAYDPNNSTLVFASTRHRQTADLYRQQPGGQAITQLTSDPANDLMPAISPDGEKIAFASDRSGNWDIYLMNANGRGNVVRITSNPAHDLHPSFSPDGERLVYSSYSQRAGQWQLAVRELGVSGSRQILGEGLFPVWSPSGDRILYQRARQRGTRWFSIWTIRYQDGAAGAPTELAASPDAALINPAWGPDGEQVVFCTVTKPTADKRARPRRADLWLMEADGGHRTRLTGGRFANLQPTWGTDGRVYFVSDRGEPTRDGIWAMTPSARPGPGTPAAAESDKAADPSDQQTTSNDQEPSQSAAQTAKANANGEATVKSQ